MEAIWVKVTVYVLFSILQWQYLQPLGKWFPKHTTPFDPDAVWYENALVGMNSLNTKVKGMCMW